MKIETIYKRINKGLKERSAALVVALLMEDYGGVQEEDRKPLYHWSAIKALLEEAVELNPITCGLDTKEHSLSVMHQAAIWSENVVSSLTLAAGLSKNLAPDLCLENELDVNGSEQSSVSPLHCAVVGREPFKIIKELVHSGANINAQAKRKAGLLAEEGDAPLHVAVKHDCLEAVKALLACGADMKIKDHAGQTAMDLAKILNRSEIALLFLNERLIDASQWRSGEIQCLINEGADVHARDGGGRVSLHYAADLNRLDAIKILLKNGAKVDEVVFTVDETKKHENGRTALHFASMEAHLPAMLLLLEHGANIQAATEEHHLTALHFAARWTPEVVSVLLDRGALVNGLKESSISPLHFAVVGREQRKVIDLLVKSGADVNARVIRQLDFAFMKRNTPLHVAIEHDCSEAVEALLAHGADMSIRNHEGKTALALAKTRERNEIVAILEGHRKLARKNLQRPSNTGSPNPT